MIQVIKFSVILVILVALGCNRELSHDHNEGLDTMENEGMFSDYVLPHEMKRKLYKLDKELEVRDQEGQVVARLEKGAIIRSASMFDLGGVDIGDNDSFTFVLSISDRSSLRPLGLIHDIGDIDQNAVRTED